MSKIARIYQGTNEIQKYYQGGVLQRLFFDWKHYIGNELNIEYAKECAGRNVMINGKTIQDSNDLSNIESVGEKEDNLVTIRNYNYKCDTDNIVLPDGTKNSIEIIDGKKVHVQRILKIVLDGTTTKATISRPWCCPSADYNSWFFTRYDSQIGRGRATCISSDPNFPFRGQNYLNLNKGAIRTGDDYTYKLAITIRNDLLEEVSLNGINNYLKKNPITVHIACKQIYTYLESGIYDDITLPDGTKNEISYSNGKHIHTRKIGKYIIQNNSYINLLEIRDGESIDYISFNIDINNMEKAFSNASLSVDKMLCDILNISDSVVGKAKEEAISMRGSGLGFCISILRSKLETEDADGFRTWLSNNPITVYYELYSFVDTDLYYDDITYKLDEPLRSLPNGICDTIEGNRLVQRVGKVVLNGSENWTESSSYNIIQITLVCNHKPQQNVFISNIFNSVGNHNKEGVSFGNSLNLWINKNRLTSPDIRGAKQWLSENPVTVYYELATPIETEITPDMILINGEPITDTVGIELPNGTKDSIENDYYVKRVGKVIIDGKNGTYQRSGTSTSTLDVYVVRNLGIQIILKNMNTNYIYQCDSEIDMSKYITVGKWISDSTSGSVVFKVPTEEYLWSDIRNAFLENPITLYVELATPVKIPLFSIKEGLTTLKSTNNITPQIELGCLVREDFQNLCDNVWEVDPSNANNIVTKNFIDVSNGTYKKFYIENLNNFSCDEMGIYGYNENDTKLVTWNPFPRPLIMPDLNIKKIKIFISGNNIEPRLYINHNTNKVLGEWELGSIDASTGENIVNGFIRMKDYTKVTPNTKYLITMWNSKAWIAFSSYDKNKNFISKISTLKKEFALITDENTYFIRINTASTFPNIPDIKITKIK